MEEMTPSGRIPARVCSNSTERTAATQSRATGRRIHAYQGNRTVGMGGGLVKVVVGGLFPPPLLPLPEVGGGDAGGNEGLEPPFTIGPDPG
jgi:hypothetical protein